MTALSSTLAPMTMASLIAIVLADPALTEPRRRNVASSIHRFCAAVDVPPDQASATFWFFRERLERFHPGQAAIEPHRWQTIRSDVAFALRRIGLAPDQPKPRRRLSDVWASLRDVMQEDNARWRLSRFARFCDARQVELAAVDDAVMDAYLGFICTQTFKTNPKQHDRDVCTSWNRLAELAPELWPVTVPPYRTLYTPTWESLRATFREEAEAWLDELLWERVKVRQAEIDARPMVQAIKASRLWEHRRPVRLLTGLVRCGHCGGDMAAVGRDYLACGNARKLDRCSQRKGLRRAVIEDFVLDQIRDRMMQPDAVKVFIDAYTREVNAGRADAEATLGRSRKKLMAVSGKLDGLFDAIADGLRSPGMLARIEALEAEKARLEAALAQPAPSPVRLHPNLAEVYREKVTALRASLADPVIRTEATEILRGLIDRIVLTPNAEGKLEIDLFGDLAGILGLAANKNGPLDASDPSIQQVKVVAGAGYQRQLLVKVWA